MQSRNRMIRGRAWCEGRGGEVNHELSMRRMKNEEAVHILIILVLFCIYPESWVYSLYI